MQKDDFKSPITLRVNLIMVFAFEFRFFCSTIMSIVIDLVEEGGGGGWGDARWETTASQLLQEIEFISSVEVLISPQIDLNKLSNPFMPSVHSFIFHQPHQQTILQTFKY